MSIASTLTLGAWISKKIEQTALAREAGTAAIYIGHFVSPLLQELATGDSLSEKRSQELEAVFQTAAMRLRVIAMKIWSTDGRILYSSHPEATGKVFPIEGALARALQGKVASEFDALDAESEAERAETNIFLEVYAPIRSRSTGEVIAVAEFYEFGDDLNAHLNTAKIQSWLVTGTVLVSLFMAFSSLVRDGSRTIDFQRRELTQRIAELSDALAKKKELRDRIEHGARRVIEEHERFLREVGSDLHDGPAQLISLALLRLDEVCIEANEAEVRTIRGALKDAMRDIRNISAGLLLPDLENQALLECLEATIRDHETKTGTKVSFEAVNLPDSVPTYVKICLCRFIQEGLSNSFRHAGGQGQSVTVKGDSDGIHANVSDTGPGMPEKYSTESGAHLGLIGLRGRLESIRGTLTVRSKIGDGTTLSAWLPLKVSL